MKLTEPYTIFYREDRDTYILSLNPKCGLPAEVCALWKRRSYTTFPDELAAYRHPRSKRAAARGAQELIVFLLQGDGAEEAPGKASTGPLAGDWIRLFTDPETSPRAKRLIGKNRPYSPQTVSNYKSIYEIHLKRDPFLRLPMDDIEHADVLGLLGRISAHRIAARHTPNIHQTYTKQTPTRLLAGTRAYEAIFSFIRMTFREYQLTHPDFRDPFAALERPKPVMGSPRQGLAEDEVLRLFTTEGVFESPLERAVAAAMFWAGLRRSEIFGLLPAALDWATPCIKVTTAWKRFDSAERVLGDPKHHKARIAPFPDILQNAIRALWEAYGQHEFVFAYEDGTLPRGTWFAQHVRAWFARAGIDLAGRNITPHSARHSLASELERKGVPLRYIQELLGHSDLKTTQGYLHTPQDAINELTRKIGKP